MTLKEAERLAYELMAYYGVTKFSFSFMQRRENFWRVGQCSYRKRVIQLAPAFVEKNSFVVVKQVILHEIAHALMPKHKHDKHWEACAKIIGCVKGKNAKTLRTYGEEVKH